MPRKSSTKVLPRNLDDIRVDIEATAATCARLRRFLDTTMSTIRSTRFRPYIVEENAKGEPVRKRHPALKELREYNATLKAAREHLAALRVEEQAILKTVAEVASDPWAEFSSKKSQPESV